MGTKITIKNNGSARVEWTEAGEVELLDPNGNKYDLSDRNYISLCRCGASAIKPFCDGAHAACEFKSEVTAGALPAPKNKKTVSS